MRVIGRTKPRGVMKVKGGCPGVFGPRSAPSGADPRPAVVAVVSTIPKRGYAKWGARAEFFLPLPTSGLVGTRRARWSVVASGGGARTRGGAGPGLAIRRLCANLLLASPALLGLSVGAPRVRRAWAGASALVRVRPARFCLPILLCSAWPSARAVGKYHEQTCWDPKDGELCLARMKPEETLVEVRSNSDVQIDCQSWV